MRETAEGSAMRYTPLNGEYARHGGKMIDFHGWALPVRFSGVIEEHVHVRARAGVFDCSHMGEFVLNGAVAVRALSSLVIGDLCDLKTYKCRYTAILNECGGIVDDCVAFRPDDNTMLLITNAGPVQKVARLLHAAVPGIRDISDDTAKIDVQGPMAPQVMLDVGFKAVEGLQFWHGKRTVWRGCDVWITRAGYTGELGYEVYLPGNKASLLWRELTRHPFVVPCGLGARDTLRTEMGYPLSGQDTDETVTPLEASMGRFIAWESDFPGKEVLLRQRAEGVKRRLCMLVSEDRRSPRHGYDLFDEDRKVGKVTSGTYGPSVSKGVGIAYVDSSLCVPDSLLKAGDRGIAVRLSSSPVYKQASGRKAVSFNQ